MQRMNKLERLLTGALFSLFTFFFTLFIYYMVLEPSIIAQGFDLIPDSIIIVSSAIPAILIGIATYKIT